MAKIHVLAGNINNLYTVVVHAPTPAGNNTAGTPWTTAIQNSGRANSILPVGNAVGQITQSELNQVQAGTLIEAVLPWGDDPTWDATQRNADLDLRATQAVSAILAQYQAELRLFGLTRT